MKKAIMSILTVWILVNVGLFSLLILSPEKDIKISGTLIIVDDDGTPGVDCNYTTIQEGIDAANPGDTVFVKNGTYYENVIVNKTINLTGEDRDTTIIDGGGNWNVIGISTNWANVSGFSVINGSHGIALGSYSNNNVLYNKISNITYDGIHLSSSTSNTIANNNVSSNAMRGIYLLNSNDNIIANNTASSNTYYGICLTSSSGNTIANNTISSNDEVGIMLSGSSTTIVNNKMIGNGICIPYGSLGFWNTHIIDTTNTVNGKPVYYWKNQTGGTVPPGGGQVILANCTNVVVENQNVSDGSVGIQLGHSNNNTIANNTASNNQFGIHLYSSNNNTIDNNNASSNIDYGIFIRGSSDSNTIVNNTTSNNIVGIRLLECGSNTITNNEMVNDGIFISGVDLEASTSYIIDTTNTVNGKPVYYWKNQTGGSVPPGAGQVILANCTNVVVENQNVSDGSVGIQLVFSKSNAVVNNTASLNKLRGIDLSLSYDNTISNNNASNNTYGIYLDISSRNNITNNKASNNDYGIFIYSQASKNIIACNTVSSNKLYGIYIEESDYWDNTFYHNNIINNINQADDNSDVSEEWDIGYPFGGNYWSDYTGNDSFKGPNQDIPGSDGIGDIPYIIDFNSWDNYPLMQPYKPIENYINLKQGWNLISLPSIQEEQNLTRGLGSIDSWYDAVQWYNSSDSSDPWKHHQISKPSHLNDLTDIDHTQGFWIHITEPDGVLFEYSGTQPTSNQSIPLHPGWNMVGYPSLTYRDRTAALNNLTFGVEVDAIWTFNAATQTWEEIVGGDYFEVGRGYWVHATQECVWEVGV